MTRWGYQRIPKNVPHPNGIHTWQQEGKLRRLWLRFHELPDEDGGTASLGENEKNRAKFYLWRHGGKAPEDDR